MLNSWSPQLQGWPGVARATDAPVREILEEWARVGGSTVLNGDAISGRSSLELVGIPEEQALDTILRGTDRYIAAIRPSGSNAVSRLGRILILAPSSAPIREMTSSTVDHRNTNHADERDARDLTYDALPDMLAAIARSG